MKEEEDEADAEIDEVNPTISDSWRVSAARFLRRHFDVPQREGMAQEALKRFDLGRSAGQMTLTRSWMQRAPKSHNMNQIQVAERLGFTPSAITKWYKGPDEPRWSHFHHYYATFGGRDEKDHPFTRKNVLNARGYVDAVNYFKETLEDAGHELGQATTDGCHPLELVLYLAFYHENALSPGEREGFRFYDDELALKQTLRKAQDAMSPFRRPTLTLDEVRRVTIAFGYPWLLCVSSIAAVERGIGEEEATTRRPIAIKAETFEMW